ncbi:MAG: hypothetical protein Ct9H300mP1_33220 [Planctomycetaceae bacterium]|nr:MAG: hypothetical protein Ct9H300mP1_33220 [Planctomycetaceae bacterium]
MSFNRVSACIEVSEDGGRAKLKRKGNARRGVGGVFNTAVIADGHSTRGGRMADTSAPGCLTASNLENLCTGTGKRPASWANVFTIRQGNRYFLGPKTWGS